MAGVKGPAFSLAAGGSVGKTLVYATWKGRPYVRRHVIPANPKSGLQVGMRAAFGFTAKQYGGLSAGDKALWATEAAADNIGAIGAMNRSAGIRARQNLGLLRDPDEPAGTTNGAPTSVTATAQPKSIVVGWTDSVTGTVWGTFIHRSTTGTFTPDISNLVHVAAAGESSWTDSGLTTGTEYFYELRHTNVGCVLGASAAEVSATPT